MSARIIIFLYGVIAYVIFLATFCYACAFIGSFDEIAGIPIPRTLDGQAVRPFWLALGIDLGLMGLFAVQHSAMARQGFKRWLTRTIPQLAERPTYVLASSVALILLFAFWEPLGGTVWNIGNPIGRALAWGVFAAGWLTVLATTFLINHFDLFGLRHAWLALLGRPYTPVPFRTPGPYRLVRHPLYVGWLLAFWGTPHMTVTHLVFAVVITAYILVAIRFEERDLEREHGESYRRYRREVGMLLPRPRRPGDAGATSGTPVALPAAGELDC